MSTSRSRLWAFCRDVYCSKSQGQQLTLSPYRSRGPLVIADPTLIPLGSLAHTLPNLALHLTTYLTLSPLLFSPSGTDIDTTWHRPQ